MALPLFVAIALAPAALGCGGASAESEGAASPAAPHPLLGKPAPDFSRDALNAGHPISLHDRAGKVTIVDFWATWCEPCRKSFPKLEAIEAKYRAAGVEVIGVSEDEDAAGIAAFASGLGAKFPLVWDKAKSIAAKWQPKSMPSTFVLDRNGTVRFVHLGYHEDEPAAIEHEIQSLL
jgi:peroxiredoxin